MPEATAQLHTPRRIDKLRTVPPEELAQQRKFAANMRAITRGEGKAYILTFGCQQNEADSEILAGLLEEMGYAMSPTPDGCDVVLVNTCAVREHAELKALSLTGQLKHCKALKPSMLIGMCGCMPSQERRLADLKNKYPYVDFALGTGLIYRLPEYLYNAVTRSGRQLEFRNESTAVEGLPVRRESSFKAWVSIMYGCDNFCSYCIVPYVRGRERSRRASDVLREVSSLTAAGYHELTLLGQNVNSWKPDDESEIRDFAELLQAVASQEGDYLVRFMTSHPKDCSEKLLDTMASSPKIARALHLPLQSGSDRVLKEMNRRYTTEQYLHLVDYARKVMPDITLTTDIIVGFPGETDEDFEGTMEMLRRVRYDNIFSFIYSPREGTRAALMEDRVPDEVTKERFAAMLALQNAISVENNARLVGRRLRVLVEGVSKSDETKLTGRTEGGRLVHFPSADHTLIGRFADVAIDSAEAHMLTGTLC